MRSGAVLGLIVALACVAGAAHAQQTNGTAEDAPQSERRPDPPGRWLDRPADFLSTLEQYGIRPRFGGLGAGSGLAFGVEIRRESFFTRDVGISVAGTASVRGYQAYDARIGRVLEWTNRTELLPADAEPAAAMSIDNDAATGVSWYLHLRQRIARRHDFFGMNGAARLENRADFGLTGLSTDAVVQWQPTKATGVSARAGWMDLEIRPGTNSRVPNLEEQFAVSALPGMTLRSSYLTLGAGIVHDRRNDARLPTSGFVIAGSAWRFVPTTSGISFGRATFDARGYAGLFGSKHVLAGRLLLSRTTGDLNDVPFYLQGTLGGSRTLRGVRNFRFRGPAIAHATLEYRWHAWRHLDIVPFVDAGFASASFKPFPGNEVVVTPGIGFRFRTASSVLGRLEVMWGPDGRRWLLAIGSLF